MRLNRFIVSILVLFLGCATLAKAAQEPVNPHATPEARALLAYLNSISGKGIVTGQHNYPNVGARWTDMAYDLTGKYPGLYGQDFGFSGGEDKDSVLSRPAMVEEVKRQWQNGAIIALTWHEVRPTDDEPVTFRESVQGKLTDYEWKQLLTPGTPLNLRWCAQVDVVAGYLRQLRDAHVPVLFRAYHEMNGGWFWWGGRPGKDGSAALYRMIYDRFVNVHHLDNLVWVWNVNAPNADWPPIAQYYPGAQYADVVSMDIYGEFKQDYYNSVLALAAGKPIALAEVGALPSVEVLNKQPLWTYFMCWSEIVRTSNTPEAVNAVYHAPQALNRDDVRLAGPMEAIRKATAGQPAAPVPVSRDASAEAKALLAQLQGAPSSGAMSGQQNAGTAPGAATAAVAQAAGRQPAIFSSDLPGGAEARKAVIAEALKAHANHAVVSLNWRPALPMDQATGAPKDPLTEFEWNELLTPGSDLNKLWLAQADAAASALKELEKAGVPVLWNPYPESNGKAFWWAGRKGVHGSAELYRQLFERLVNHDGLHNLVWVWEAAEPGFRPDAAGAVTDYFPGLLYADAVEIRVSRLDPWAPADRFLGEIATGKPIGVDLTGDVPQAEALTGRGGWAWFVIAPRAAAPEAAEALRKLYADGHVASLSLKQ
jgi:mannan endo-1,4-beta-mannosidase